MKKILLLHVLCISLSINTWGMNIRINGPKNSFFQNKFVYKGFGCQGENKMPEIAWSDLPKEAKYIGVTMYDPDAPTGGGWWHMLVSNIPAKKYSKMSADNFSQVLSSGAISSINSYGTTTYGGPCPPKGDQPHRYIITVFAMKNKIDVKKSSMPGLVGYMLNAGSIVHSQATLLYGR